MVYGLSVAVWKNGDSISTERRIARRDSQALGTSLIRVGSMISLPLGALRLGVAGPKFESGSWINS
jgi:hypothetical protein